MSDHRHGSVLLLALWATCVLGGLATGGVFAAGLLRDSHFGQGGLAVDLGRAGPWQSTDFRVWSDGPHVLWLTTLRHEPPFDPEAPYEEVPGLRYDGRLEIRILTPEDSVLLERDYGGSQAEHLAGGGGTWTRLVEVDLSGLPVRRWKLEARVTEADPAFTSRPELRSELLLRRDRPPAGMGGLITYVMIFPAALLLLLSLGLGLLLARRGGRLWPVGMSSVFLVLFYVLFLSR